MKRLAILTALLALTLGCSTPVRQYRNETSLFVLDLRPFAAEGFLFTPDPMYSGKYEPIGLVTLRVAAAGHQEQVDEALRLWEWERIELETILRQAQRSVIEMGGNALINFRIESRPNPDDRPVYEVSGFAIKRLDVSGPPR